MIAELSQLDAAGRRHEIDTIFELRGTRATPASLPPPPAEWADQEAGRGDDRVGWAELVREAKEPEARRFDAVIVYSTSRLSLEEVPA